MSLSSWVPIPHSLLSSETTIIGLTSGSSVFISYSRNTFHSAAVDSVAPKFTLAFLALSRFARTFSLSHVAFSAFTGIRFGRGPSV